MITRLLVTNYRSLQTFEFKPNEKLNIIVGDNDTGKSTVLEVITLALSGRIKGRWAADDLNPHWFNHAAVQAFFDELEAGNSPSAPEISIELYLSTTTKGAERLRGIHNSRNEDTPGISIHVKPDPDHAAELTEYLAQENIPRLIPTELYMVEWRDFSDGKLSRQPAGLGHTVINASGTGSYSGVDFKMRQLLKDFVTTKESVQISLAYRQARVTITEGVLKEVDDRIAEEGNSFGVGLQMDQSSNTSWEAAVTPHIEKVPFALLGQGKQVATKVALAMSRNSDRNQFVLVEEPENHLSHSNLQELIAQISSLAGSRQIFITTHSSFVLNRLGFDHLYLMSEHGPKGLNIDLVTDDTIKYFQRQSGYDTLRLAIAKKAVVVEGPSDEMIFNKAYKSIKGVEPRESGVDVVTLGTRGKRALELAHALNKKVAVLRDNDGKEPEYWKSTAATYLETGRREMFIGSVATGVTLEPQILTANGATTLRAVLGLDSTDDVADHMKNNKTDSAWQIVNSTTSLEWPAYIKEAIEFISAE
ncbi:MAG TPA: AAA family ATPase [Dongiaceae bacterium]|nr:AAA family ATPase [Dongiaceae bacterium]